MGRKRTGTPVQRNGSWFAKVTVDVDGKPVRRWVALGTTDRRIADAKLARLVKDLASGKPLPYLAEEAAGPGTVSEFAKVYVAKMEAAGKTSARDDENNLRRYILPFRESETGPAFGERQVTDVRVANIARVLDAAVSAGLAKETVRHIRACMFRVFDSAWRLEIIQENPVAKVAMPSMREVKRRRVILTDPEFAQFIACPKVDLELRMMSLASRIEGGMRTGDVNSWDWTMIDLLNFSKCVVPRVKTGEPQELDVPEVLRPFLRAWWERSGSPASGPVFPVRRGRNEGGFKAKRGVSYAKRLRRGLFAAGVVRMPPVEVPATSPGTRTDMGRKATGTRPAPNPRDPLYHETATSLPVDFHSFRRAFNTALASTGVNVQTAMRLAGHSDAKTHMLYVLDAPEMRVIPAGAIPLLGPSDSVTAEDDSTERHSDSARHRGFEPLAFGSGDGRLGRQGQSFPSDAPVCTDPVRGDDPRRSETPHNESSHSVHGPEPLAGLREVGRRTSARRAGEDAARELLVAGLDVAVRLAGDAAGFAEVEPLLSQAADLLQVGGAR